MSSVTIRIPYPPSVNHYWGSRVIVPKVRGKKPFINTFIGERGKQFRVDVQAAVLSRWGLLKPSGARLAITIVAVMPDRRKRDIDNAQKAVLDSLFHARVIKDDSQVDDLRIIRGPVRPPGWLEVTIRKLADGESQPELQFADEEKPF